MRLSRPFLVMAALSLAAAAGVHPALAAGCADRSAELDRAVSARALDAVKRLETAIFQAGVDCFGERQTARDKRVALELALAADPAGPLRTEAERESALLDASTRSDSWLASKALADFQAQHGRFAEATANYDAGIDRLQFAHPSDAQKRDLLTLAGAAKALASDDREGTVRVSLKPSSRASNGTVGGIFSPALRGAVPTAVPLPIQFATASAELTPTGRQAADELVKALKEQNVPQATLVGHTDTRGAPDYNMRLSERRLETVKLYLKSQGIGSDIVLVPKGLSEPFDVKALPYRLTQEEVWALDRRVDWVRPPAGQ